MLAVQVIPPLLWSSEGFSQLLLVNNNGSLAAPRRDKVDAVAGRD